MKNFFLVSCVALFLVSCGSMQYAQFPTEFNNEGKKVSVTVKHTNFLGFSPMKNTNKVMEGLSKKCKKMSGGNVQNVTVQVVRKGGFGMLTTEITAFGYCCCEE